MCNGWISLSLLKAPVLLQATNTTTASVFLLFCGCWNIISPAGIYHLPSNHHFVTFEVCPGLHFGMLLYHGGVHNAERLEAATSTYDSKRASSIQCRSGPAIALKMQTTHLAAVSLQQQL
jgi:hypothetical protein